MQPAQPRELGILKPRDHAEYAHLFGMLQLGLETDDVPQRPQRIILAQLDYRIGPTPSLWVIQPHRLHRSETQRIDTAFGHDLDRHAALEIGRVGLPLLERGLVASNQRGVESEIFVLVHRTVDVVRAALVPACGAPADVHVDAVVVDDRGERVEEGEAVFPRLRTDGLGEQGGSQRASRDDRGTVRQHVDPFAHKRDVRMVGDRIGHALRVSVAVDRQSRPRGHAVPVCLAHDQRVQRPHLLMQQADRIRFRVIRAERVRTDQFGEVVGPVCGRLVTTAPHLGQADLMTRLGELPCGLGSCHPAANHVNVVSHDDKIPGRS